MKTPRTLFLLLSSLIASGSGATETAKALAVIQASSDEVAVEARSELRRLLRQEDADGDKKITVEDLRAPGPRRAKGAFALRDRKGGLHEVMGTYFLSNLLQELKLAIDEKRPTVSMKRIFENPVRRTSRLIRETYWDHLTRRVDAGHLEGALADSKLPPQPLRYLYVPADDPGALAYYQAVAVARPGLKLAVRAFSMGAIETARAEIRAHPGLLALALRKNAAGVIEGVPFVVPGGRFNEMYGWDSYFEALGLLADGRVDLARAMVDNLVYEIRHYGKILNANRSYYLDRSQPPFLTSMIAAIYEKIKTRPDAKVWLTDSLGAAMAEYFNVWLGPTRITDTGLSRYFGAGRGIPPEVEKGHFDVPLEAAAKRQRLTVTDLRKRYDAGDLLDPELDAFFAQDASVRESGHDTTHRWQVDGADRAADFLTVDLNSLLYKYELDFARLIDIEYAGGFPVPPGVPAACAAPSEWRGRAARRKAAMLQYLWDPGKQTFFDYNYRSRTRSNYLSATAIYPYWAQDPADPSSRLADGPGAAADLGRLVARLEELGGLSATGKASWTAHAAGLPPRQWDYPNGWAPHQMIAWEALANYGRMADRNRLIYKWLYMIARNAADYNGTVPEKFDVVKRSHAVFAEYGNVGTHFAYIAPEGFGWMNASFEVGLRDMAPEWRARLEDLVPPEHGK